MVIFRFSKGRKPPHAGRLMSSPPATNSFISRTASRSPATSAAKRPRPLARPSASGKQAADFTWALASARPRGLLAASSRASSCALSILGPWTHSCTSRAGCFLGATVWPRRISSSAGLHRSGAGVPYRRRPGRCRYSFREAYPITTGLSNGRSQHSANSKPPPWQKPLMAAMGRLGHPADLVESPG